MIHGKTKIELYNPNTKIKNIIKSENTFQSNVLADYFRHFGEEDANPFSAGNYDATSLWKNALGGLFLLKNPETIGNKFMSLGNVMIGNGAYGVSNSGSPNELGSYNSQESSESGTEISMVYDFATNQANGNIACVCLTSRVGGYIGYGNRDGQYHASRSYGFSSLQSTRGAINFNTQSAYGNWVLEVSGDFSEGTIKIVKTRRSLITGSVFNGFSKTVEFDLSEVGDGYGISGRSESFGCYKLFDIGNGIYRFIPTYSGGKTVAPNGTVYYYEYDAENDTLTQKSFINSSSNTLLVTDNVTETTLVWFYENYAFCLIDRPTQAAGYIAHIFDINTSEHLETLNARTISGENGSAFRRQWTLLLDRGWVAFCVKSNGIIYMFDTVNGTVYPTNSNAPGFTGMIKNPSLGAGILGRSDSQPTESRTRGFYHNPLYLATINNLDSYVTKTANQTMKVTYTLTEE